MILLLIVIVIPLTGAGIDIYVPSLPAIMQHFATDQDTVQTSVSIYLLCYGLGQLILGTLSDCFGRRIILLPTTIILAFASLLSVFAPTIEVFLLSRAIQGLMVAGPGVVMKAVMCDCFRGRALSKASNYLTMAWAAGPILSPLLGGYLQEYVGWQANFYFLFGYAAAIFLLLWCYLPETLEQRTLFRPRDIVKNYKTIVMHRHFIVGFCVIALSYGMMAVFNVIGPFLIEVRLGYTASQFGHFVTLLGVAWFIGNMGNRVLLQYYDNPTILSVATIVTGLLTLSMVVFTRHQALSLPIVIGPVCLAFLCGGIMTPNGFALAMTSNPHMGGFVNAMQGCLFVIAASMITQYAVTLDTHTHMPLLSLYAAMAVANIVVFYSLRATSQSTKTK